MTTIAGAGIDDAMKFRLELEDDWRPDDWCLFCRRTAKNDGWKIRYEVSVAHRTQEVAFNLPQRGWTP